MPINTIDHVNPEYWGQKKVLERLLSIVGWPVAQKRPIKKI